jgi:hypothetical protein
VCVCVCVRVRFVGVSFLVYILMSEYAGIRRHLRLRQSVCESSAHRVYGARPCSLSFVTVLGGLAHCACVRKCVSLCLSLCEGLPWFGLFSFARFSPAWIDPFRILLLKTW